MLKVFDFVQGSTNVGGKFRRNIHETTNIIFTKTLILLTLVTSTPTPKRVSKTQ